MAPTQPNTPINAQVYPGIQYFSDPNQQLAVRTLWDRVHTIEGRPSDTSPTFRSNPNLGGTALSRTKGLRISNAADPIDPGDYVTKRYADVTYAGPGLAQALVLGNPALANISPLLGGSTALLFGTHAERLSSNPPTGSTFYETDRAALYGYTTYWTLLGNCPEMVAAGLGGLPADLGANDVGFYALDTQTGLGYLWDGAEFHWHKGLQYGLIANRPVAFTGCDAGVLYCASDMGDHVWQLNYAAGAWVLLKGVGGPLNCTTGSLPSLGGNDAGFQVCCTDFDRCYNWNGSAWSDSPGQPTRGMIVYANGSLGTGWALCNGAGATSSTSSGGTTGITTPNLISTYVQGYTSAGITGFGVTLSYTTGATVLNDIPFYSLLPFIRL
jgi:hypothetical protein